MVDFDVIKDREEELKKMNEGKAIGELYHYSDSFVQLLACIRAYFHLPYRQTEGVIVKGHARRRVTVHTRLQYSVQTYQQT
jgi:hypothetical protein